MRDDNTGSQLFQIEYKLETLSRLLTGGLISTKSVPAHLLFVAGRRAL
jgi:hypothetical protein